MKTKLYAGAVAVFAACGPVAYAADMPVKAPVVAPAPPAWVWEVGARYWYSSGKNWYNYYADTTTAQLNSRLTYDALSAHSGEGYFRADSPWRGFLKGFIGGGKIVGGHLYDEDFPPAIVPYSKTISDTRGDLSYASIDAGYSFYDGRGPGGGAATRLGAFVGYHYWHEKVDAFGCSQIGGGNICAGGGAIPTSVRVITEEDTWNALRIGGVADFWFTPALKLTAEAAYVRVWQKATDTHYFTFGPDPATGNGNGVEAEAVLSYQVSRNFNLGIGGRWWHYNTDAIDRFNQLLKYTTDRYGVFAQAGMTF